MGNPGTSPASELQPGELLDLPLADRVRISPSGKHVVYSVQFPSRKGDHDVSSLWLADVGKHHSARQLTSGLFNDINPEWCADSETIAFISDRAKPGNNTAIYLISIAGGEAYPLTSSDHVRSISLFTWSPNGQCIAFASADEKTPEQERQEKEKDDARVYGEDVEFDRLRVIHVATREVTVLYSENAHVAQLGWSPDSKSIAFTVKPLPDQDSGYAKGVSVQLVTLAKERKQLFHFPGMIESCLVWKADKIYFLAGAVPHAVTSSSMLYYASLGKGSGNDTVRFSKHSHGVEDCAKDIRSTKDSVALLVEAGMKDEIEVDGVNLYSKEQAIWTFDALQTDAGKTLLAFVTTNTETPPEVYSKEQDSNDSVQLSNHGHALADRKLGTYHPLTCPTFDNTATLEGYYITPTALPSPKPLPTYVHIHGGPYFRATSQFDPSHFSDGWIPTLLSASKYGILVPNYRGGSSQGDAFTAPARGRIGTVDYDDILSMVEAGISAGHIDPSRILVGGWSQGGFLSYLCATRNGSATLPNGEPRTWRFRGAICGAGISDWDMEAMTSNSPYLETETLGTAPWVAEKGDLMARRGSAVWEMSSATHVPPVLILHGEVDDVCPLSQAEAFHRGCLYHGFACEKVVYPREPHGIRERAHVVDMLKRVRRFCDTHLL